jgi:hypothetical protein
MKKENFEKLGKSVKKGAEILRGSTQLSREFSVGKPSPTQSPKITDQDPREYLDALIIRASKSWDGVADPDEWLRNIRGGDDATD